MFVLGDGVFKTALRYFQYMYCINCVPKQVGFRPKVECYPYLFVQKTKRGFSLLDIIDKELAMYWPKNRLNLQIMHEYNLDLCCYLFFKKQQTMGLLYMMNIFTHCCSLIIAYVCSFLYFWTYFVSRGLKRSWFK